MYRLSSNATLFLKLFVPVFWTTILTALTLVAWFVKENQFEGAVLTSFRYGTLFALVVGVVSFFFIFWPLKRVETDGEKVYISNYFRTAFYRWDSDVEKLTETRFLFFRFATIHLNGIGSFGRKLRFLADKSLLDNFRAEAPANVRAVVGAPKE
ncbi:hypothetical protein [Lewinella sp. 4G2]|uniref:hypothetical protein n=1 Tax=Lewinella sp. 4G2 TaxID=1803372 RepID=UPI0007B45F51|nr:hypothetical protein [Lewinella sp. 4G2]OAV42661.1 hypothetical protein A3850_015570 [Lewinella sp. 4G2]